VMIEFIAGCLVGFVLAVIAVALGIASTVGARRWKP
jgi:hypothetical protein